MHLIPQRTIFVFAFVLITASGWSQESAFFRHDSTPIRAEWWDGAPIHEFPGGIVLKRNDVNTDYSYGGTHDGVVWMESFPGVLYGQPVSKEAIESYPLGGGYRKDVRFYNKDRELLKRIIVPLTNPFIDSLDNIKWGSPSFETHIFPPEDFDPATVEPTEYWTSTSISIPKKNGFVIFIHHLFPFYKHYRLPMKSVMEVVAPNGQVVFRFSTDGLSSSPNVSNDGSILAFLLSENKDASLMLDGSDRELRVIDLRSKEIIYSWHFTICSGFSNLSPQDENRLRG